MSPWNRVWEVLCPDCNEIRSLKDRPKRGIVVRRCRTCALKIRDDQSPRTKRNRGWRWAGEGNVRCILWPCTDCNNYSLVLWGNLVHKNIDYRCLSCALRHSISHDPEKKNSIARANLGVQKGMTIALRHCALCGDVKALENRSIYPYLFCTKCKGVHASHCRGSIIAAQMRQKARYFWDHQVTPEWLANRKKANARRFIQISTPEPSPTRGPSR